MNITIKQLQGGECSVEVTPTTKILDIKQHIATKLRIPIEEQKLLLLGRALIDNQTVESYPSIKNGTKLNLVVKKPDGLLEAATKCFKKNGMSETEARTKASLLIKVVEEKFSKLSWDDIERLSLDCMLEECAQLQPVQEQDTECEDVFPL
ncbi:ubiquitin-like protein 4A [Maniola hyperantus]|uniref:ubiquitin-like protein 4A n=1 Tax=Aphantopus hyperantus TaxID=2795564 RepID=UPI00156983B2|nr:ubiquitin-like protein 4A isoform X1 [Maniola hyperantus]XP_034824222.1 ubiquitin-like protein 4A isoform X2 [Maniola hyperantus]